MTREEAIQVTNMIEVHGSLPIQAKEKAIEALKQEPFEDAISRQAAIEAACDIMCGKLKSRCKDIGDCGATDAIKALPPVTPARSKVWIPVSERLPEEDGFYLATCDGEICGEDKPFTGLAEFENGKWIDDEDNYQCIIAWMPLPEPYKAESEDKECI